MRRQQRRVGLLLYIVTCKRLILFLSRDGILGALTVQGGPSNMRKVKTNNALYTRLKTPLPVISVLRVIPACNAKAGAKCKDYGWVGEGDISSERGRQWLHHPLPSQQEQKYLPAIFPFPLSLPFWFGAWRDFRLQFFFMNQCPPGPWVYH